MPVIGSYVPQKGGEPQQAIYSEIYWVKEDRLGPLLPEPCGDYDRGKFSTVCTRLVRQRLTFAFVAQAFTSSSARTRTAARTGCALGSPRSRTTASPPSREPSVSTASRTT